MSHLRVDGLSVQFEQVSHFLPATNEVRFELEPGQTVALLGGSGCGKSITASALMRLLPENAYFGQQSKVLLEGQDLLTLPERDMRDIRGKRVAMIFQEPMTALNPVLTIGQQLAEAIKAHQPLRNNALNKRMLQLLEEVDMSEAAHRLNQYPHQLSGGQKQRVVIAMALACEPDVLIADEPTTALDVTVQAQILKLLKRIQQQHHMSLLLITHDLGVVRFMASQVCVMYAGQIVEMASAEDFFTEVKHPYSQQLLAAIPSLHNRQKRLAAIPGSVPTLDDMPKGCRFHPRCSYQFPPCLGVEPALQPINDGEVRCHLYPDTLSLPPLKISDVDIAASREDHTKVLSVQNLSVTFPLQKSWLKSRRRWLQAVDNVSFDLYRGKTLALVGESGCGKTTISRAIMMLLTHWQGDIDFDGQSIKKMTRKQLRQFRQQAQIIFQDPFSSMNPRMSVSDIISEGMRAQGYSSAKIKKRLFELIEQVNLPKSCLNRFPHQFSGGQRQRISIARALACRPHLLICDEPTSALDVSVQAQILNLLKDLQAEYNMAYLFITHNMSVVSYLADDVMVMKKGSLVEQGPVTQIMTKPQQPYTQRLLKAVL
ncbi:dipeptide ABC transporter ATP-binding protein [Legionella sp. W05-934-2]|uniref:dipeptide ABC transporter ATP-binding protein n=1 Tax=Legionella sp. W05-934-2 TaxID=1198649 RepID=UPI0034632691